MWPTPASRAIPWWKSRGSGRATTASGGAGACPPRRSGRRPRAATTPAATPGASAARPRTRRLRPGVQCHRAGVGRPEGASPLGVQDMIGNLREWTSSVPPLPVSPRDGREGAEQAPRVVVRGASHDDPPHALRVHDQALLRAPGSGARAPFRRVPLRHVGRSRRDDVRPMKGLIMDYPLTLTHFFERTRKLFHKKTLATRVPGAAPALHLRGLRRARRRAWPARSAASASPRATGWGPSPGTPTATSRCTSPRP